jgi:hypothetical protein
MSHSIAAKYAARPAARFVRPSARFRQRRLGLGVTGSFSPAPARATVLRTIDLGPLVALRAASRSLRPATVRRAVSGPPRPSATIQWARGGPSGTSRRPGAAVAPWQG